MSGTVSLRYEPNASETKALARSIITLMTQLGALREGVYRWQDVTVSKLLDLNDGAQTFLLYHPHLRLHYRPHLPAGYGNGYALDLRNGGFEEMARLERLLKAEAEARVLRQGGCVIRAPAAAPPGMAPAAT